MIDKTTLYINRILNNLLDIAVNSTRTELNDFAKKSNFVEENNECFESIHPNHN